MYQYRVLKVSRSHNLLLLCLYCFILSGCFGGNTRFAPAIAEPNARPARNFTSFAQSLRCMDRLLSQESGPTYLISSTDIPDDTKDLDVGADDMLINAINQLNRSNRRYVFLDQARISSFGQLELLTTRKEEEVKPHLYIRGSISQLDTDTVDNEISNTFSDDNSRKRLLKSSYHGFRKLSVVSVDMHLVQYPSRRIIPGSSIANSMVVVKKGFSGRISGIIDLSTIGLAISIDRIESQSQAVRNLIELGVIELLGRHADVPYWQCLATPETDSKQQQKSEYGHLKKGGRQLLISAQDMLISLGYLSGRPTGQLNQNTRRAIAQFQSKENLLPNGIVDFDLMKRLQKRIDERRRPKGEKQAKPVEVPFEKVTKATKRVHTQVVTSSPSNKAVLKTVTGCDDNEDCAEAYKNVFDFIKEHM